MFRFPGCRSRHLLRPGDKGIIVLPINSDEVDVAALAPSGPPAPDRSHGVWVAFHWDFSGFTLFESEIQARRHGNKNHMEVRLVPYGEDVRQYLAYVES